jgi:hypothetical protein
MTIVFEGKAGVDTYRAITLKHAIAFYAKTGMKVNRAYTPTAMLRAAGEITGQTFKRGQYEQAVAALEAWIQANGTNGRDQ